MCDHKIIYYPTTQPIVHDIQFYEGLCSACAMAVCDEVTKTQYIADDSQLARIDRDYDNGLSFNQQAAGD